MRTLLTTVAVLLGACGGDARDSELRASLALAATGNRACMPMAEYQTAKAAGAFRPLPLPLPDGHIWIDPWVLIPAAGSDTIEAAPGWVGKSVVVTGPDGLPKHVTGMFYVEMQTPEWVCPPTA